MTVDELIEAVDNDKECHRTKELTQLFINAMKDWPTFNQKDIGEFIKELKEYFGAPLTIEKINSKSLDSSNSWKHEAGTSIAELIDISSKLDSEPNFDKIIDKILNFYKR